MIFILKIGFANFKFSLRRIGLTDKATDGTFVWANGETSSYRNWAPGEPNNWPGENYVTMYPEFHNWNDSYNDYSYQGIIELNATGIIVSNQ